MSEMVGHTHPAGFIQSMGEPISSREAFLFVNEAIGNRLTRELAFTAFNKKAECL